MCSLYLAIRASLAHLCSRLWCPRFDILDKEHEGSDSWPGRGAPDCLRGEARRGRFDL